MQSVTITIKPANTLAWNNDLAHFRYSMFHLTEWVECAASDTCRPIYLDFWKDNDIIAKIAGLVILDKRKTLGKQLFFYAGPSMLVDDPQTTHDCLEALSTFAKKKRYSRIKQFPFDSKTALPFAHPRYRTSAHKEYVFKLDAEYNTFKPGQGLRKKLQLAEAAETEFHISNDPAHLDLLLNLMQKTMEMRVGRCRNSYNLFSFNFINKESLRYLLECKKGVIYYSLNHGEIHYLTLSFEHNNRAYGLYNGTDEFGYKNGLPAFMATKLAQYYQSKGFTYFNLGTNPPNKEEDFHLSNFKKQLGCVPVDVHCAFTQFLVFPQNMITLAMKMGKKLPHNRLTKRLVKAMN